MACISSGDVCLQSSHKKPLEEAFCSPSLAKTGQFPKVDPNFFEDGLRSGSGQDLLQSVSSLFFYPAGLFKGSPALKLTFLRPERPTTRPPNARTFVSPSRTLLRLGDRCVPGRPLEASSAAALLGGGYLRALFTGFSDTGEVGGVNSWDLGVDADVSVGREVHVTPS